MPYATTLDSGYMSVKSCSNVTISSASTEKLKHETSGFYLGLFLKGCSTSLHFLLSTSSSQPSPWSIETCVIVIFVGRQKDQRLQRCRSGFILIGLQSTLRPPNRNRELSDTAVSVCHDLPTGAGDDGTLKQNKHVFAQYCQRKV